MKKMQNWQENIPMTKDKFWEVIDNARAIAPALEGEPLRESLYKQLLMRLPSSRFRSTTLNGKIAGI